MGNIASPESQTFARRGRSGRDRVLSATLALCLHLLVLWGVIHGFGGVPARTGGEADPYVARTFDVPLEKPKPTPSPTAPEPSGASGAEGRKAKAKPVVARARVPSRPEPAPPSAATGNDVRSGAAAKGEGTGGGGEGMGTGSGASGNGSGGGLARKAEKISGDIRSTRDYPKSQQERIGKRVVILLDVSAEGRVTGCRVWRASGVPEADAITCRLASERFRFRPATDAEGRPVASTYGWEQRWFAP